MAEPTFTRAALRQSIGRAVGMPFYRYYNSALTVAVLPPETNMIEQDELTQPDHYWEGSWLLLTKVAGVASETIREIISFVAYADRLVIDRGVTGVTTSDTFEITSGWTPYEIHDAIDRAIESAFPWFFDTTTDETLVIKKDTTSYDISGLTVKPFKVMTMWIEQPSASTTGAATAADATHITLAAGTSAADMATYPTRYVITIYDGTGAGQCRVPSAYNNTTKQATVTTWTTTPDTTSKYCFYDTTDQQYDWKKINVVRTDSKDWPSTLYLTTRYSEEEGHRIRLQYLSKPAALTLDASTTIVPEEYILLKAISLLARMRTPNNRYDRARFGQMAQDYEKEADAYKRSNMWQPTPGTVWGEQDVTYGRAPVPDGDPMGWRS